jgi:hypothetical protein
MKSRDKFQIGRAALLRGLDFGRRGSAALPLIAVILFFAAGAMAQTTNDLSDAEIQGRNLARQLAIATPAENSTNTGTLKIRDARGNQKVFFLRVQTMVTTTNWQNRGANWQNSFETIVTNADGSTDGEYLKIVHFKTVHAGDAPDEYVWKNHVGGGESVWDGTLPNGFVCQFSKSDFCAVDLGLEFLHWPEQKILKHEMRRGRSCRVLENTNPYRLPPNGAVSPNAYSRVDSWIDEETLGIVHAEAYDAKGKLLKEFDPKSFKKVNGQWELQDMEIRNVQTGSRTRLEFDLKAH